MSLIQRVLVRALQSTSSTLFARCFSVCHGAQAKEDFARLRQEDPEAYRQYLDKAAANKRRWLEKPGNAAKMREYTRLHHLAHRGDKRGIFYKHLLNWGKRFAWFRDTLPWKSHRPVFYDDRVEHYCEGCGWTEKNGKKLWWRRIQSPSTAEADSWLCTNCYVPKSDCREAMPRGYEDLTSIKEISKRRDELGHGA